MADDSQQKSASPLMTELNSMYRELQVKLEKTRIFGQSLKPAIEPLQRVMIFVGKVVKKTEALEERVKWLELELNKRDQERVEALNVKD